MYVVPINRYYHSSINRIEHQRLHEKHKGHEAMHAEMVLILIATLVVAQVLLVQWKTRHFKSYQVSLLRVMQFVSSKNSCQS